MSIKKIIAAALASVMAVSTLAVSAFAGSLEIPGSDTADRNTEFKGKDAIAEFLEGNDPANIESITFKGTGTFSIAYDKADGTWYQNNDDAKNEWTIAASEFNWEKEDQCIKFCIYHADATPDPVTVEWTFNLKAAETTAAEAAPEATTAAEAAPEATTAAEAAPAENNNAAAPADDKGNADTGIEGVAVVASLAVLAAGAIVVAKKRK